jgi:hypothetical protein
VKRTNRRTNRRTHRADANSAELVKAARKLGMIVHLIGKPVDALVAVGGLWFPVELKNGKGKYTEAQVEFQTQCAEHHAPMLTWRTLQDVADCAYGLLGSRG